jgi:predicted transcriptional regulator
LATEKEIVVSGEKALKLVDALNGTTLKILKLIRKEPLSVTAIANKLGLSEAYLSHEIQNLENLKIISTRYAKGARGVSKISESNLEKITITFNDEDLVVSE